MTHLFSLPPPQPDHPQVQPPLIYVREPLVWEYKQIVRDLNEEGVLGLEALNRLGAEGWELASVVTATAHLTYIFKRIAG